MPQARIRLINLVRTSSILSGLSSCIQCPLSWTKTIWNFPCICATVKLVSMRMRSRPANTIIFGIRALINCAVIPLNHPSQCSSDNNKSVLHTYRSSCSIPTGTCRTSCEGMDKAADSGFDTHRFLRAQLTASCGDLKTFGRVFTILVIDGRAAIAVPSTTSTTTSPITLNFSAYATLTAIAPPSECPTRTIGVFLGIALAKTLMVSSRSWLEDMIFLSWTLVFPWPLRSYDTTRWFFFIRPAKIAHDIAECPAPCIHPIHTSPLPAE
mmetsp:Transcript_30469/g.48911  ORF Transcript_30469/g.48911 Transcript_30469/m.48911 type:complete len:268 (+) Transcript_30469:188-991(+)